MSKGWRCSFFLRWLLVERDGPGQGTLASKLREAMRSVWIRDVRGVRVREFRLTRSGGQWHGDYVTTTEIVFPEGELRR